MSKFFRILRINQWYKNLMIFLPLFFSQNIFNILYLQKTVIGLISLCLISSSYYIINDIVDKKKDSTHSEKKKRPIASGEIRVYQGLIISMILFFISLTLAYSLSQMFVFFVLALFGLSMLYTFWLKRELFADILLISVNFVLRGLAGAYVISPGIRPYIEISPWLILCPFFLALFLATGKRRAEQIFLGNKSKKYNALLAKYDATLLNSMMTISTTLFIISYSLYSFLSRYSLLLLTLPFALYTILRYYSLIEQGSVVARNTEKALKDIRLLIGSGLWVLSVFLIIYLN